MHCLMQLLTKRQLMPKKEINRILFFTPAIGWGVLICYFSLMPSIEVPSMLKSISDFVLHFSIYGALSLLIFLGFTRFTFYSIALKKVNLVMVFCILLGLAIELIQEKFIPGRQFEWSDVLFNSLGSMLVAALNKIVPASKL